MYNILGKKLWQIYNIAGNYVLLHYVDKFLKNLVALKTVDILLLL